MSIMIHGITGASMPTSTINKNQYISCTDIISEGPIDGLVKGSSSIYLDSSAAADESQAGQHLSNGPANFTFNGSTAVSVANETLSSFTGGTSTGRKYLRIIETIGQTGANAVRTNTTENPEITITADSSFFLSWMVQDPTNSPNNQPVVRLELSDKTYFIGYITNITSNTVATAVPAGSVIPNEFLDKTGGEYKVIIDGSYQIASNTASAITLSSATNVPTGTYKCDITDAEHHSSFTNNNVISDTSKYKSFSYQFRKGTLYQPPIHDIYGGGSTSITANHGDAFIYNDAGSTWPDESEGTPIYLTSADMNLSASTARQVDEVRLVFSYPALIQSSNESQKIYNGLQAYKIEIAINKGSGFGDPVDYFNYRVDGEFYYHRAEQNNSFYIQENLDLDRFKPFTDFRLKITKCTRDDVGINKDGTYDDPGHMNVQFSSALASTVCIVKERFTYPWTAYANVRVDAETFNNVPKRSYLCRGRLVLVPSNYVTREESSDGIANYRRDPGSGVVDASEDQDWDGNFRSKLVYTDNPAWVFFDILNNSRYGLGSWLKYKDFDIYTLYRIARYCDELVPDGKGSTEPRFKANIYLTKATESYKVIKDMATTFRAILYWSEGHIVPVVDQAKDPVFNFTKGNVIEGAFNYEGTGAKLRSNQVVVTWNNPENDYTPEALLVEDKQNIVETGKIISEEAVAFGATSIGQATRYGRWKLWTAINQSEVVSFKTALNAVFLAPGDIVNIQDADRYDVAYSGRISSTGTINAGVIPLDRTITLNSGSAYDLSVIISAPVPFLAQDKATISTVNYERGDIIPGFTTNAAASNIQDDDDVIVQINWAPYTHVETQSVNTDDGATATLSVSTNFSVAPERESIWVLREVVTASGVIADASKKMYKILDIKDGGKNIYDIIAVEHYNQKFDDIDIDFGQPYVDTLLPPGEFVPAITNLNIIKS